MTAVKDGEIELRARASCVNTDSDGRILGILSENTAEAVLGFKDMTPPEALGYPSLVNGILNAGDEISVTFNEDIQPATSGFDD
jgi:hypothetical protein